MLGRGRRRRDNGEAEDELQEGIPSGRSPDEHDAPWRGENSSASLSGPEGVRDQLERLAGQIRGLQQQVEGLVARRNDAMTDHATQRVTTILQAAEDSAAEIAAEANNEAAQVLERARDEALSDADRIMVQAQADAGKIRADAHAAAALLRQQVLDEITAEVERTCAQLADDLQTAARAAVERVASTAAEAAPPEAPLEPEAPTVDPDEAAGADVEEAVDELQSAAAVLEQSLRHLHEIGQGLPDSE